MLQVLKKGRENGDRGNLYVLVRNRSNLILQIIRLFSYSRNICLMSVIIILYKRNITVKSIEAYRIDTNQITGIYSYLLDETSFTSSINMQENITYK